MARAGYRPCMETATWYEGLREKHRPGKLEVLLVGESPPDPGRGERRFFYAPTLSYDNLYRGVAMAVYGEEPGFDLTDKPAVLERLKSDGFWLIDAVGHPINKSSSAEPARRSARAFRGSRPAASSSAPIAAWSCATGSSTSLRRSHFGKRAFGFSTIGRCRSRWVTFGDGSWRDPKRAGYMTSRTRSSCAHVRRPCSVRARQ
jgi:hypothetical protein